MTAPLRLSLRVTSAPPEVPSTRNRQIWKGGATDLATRRMIADPTRWLLIAECDGDQAINDDNALLSWDMEQVLPGREPSPSGAGGVILVSMDVDPTREEEFNDWYDTEHIPHFKSVAGVITARRFRARRGQPRYVALYHVANTDVYATREWMVANETPWILRMRRFQRNRTYFMFSQWITG